MERAITRARRARRAARCLLRPQSLTPSPETRTRRSSPPGSVRRWPRIAALLLATASAATCFTGDGLVDQPCQSDEDCNPLTDALGQSLRCEYNICGYSQRCGDGIVDDAREKCDDGDANVKSDHGDGPRQCSASACRLLPYCGDKAVDDPREACDDGNENNTDACLNTCQAATCGDGFVGPGEACDPKADPDCTDACARPSCGDGLVQGDEACAKRGTLT